jgi:hypothetical protein
MSNVACSGCGTAVAPANVLYTSDARVVCAKCFAAADIADTDKRHAKNILNAAIGCAFGGVLTFFSPLSGMFFIVVAFAAVTIAGGIYALMAMANLQPRFAVHLGGGERVAIWILSIFGIVLAGLIAVSVLAGLGLLLG